MMIHRSFQVASQFGVGLVAAAATTAEASSMSSPWTGLLISVVTIVCSVVLTGVINNRLHESQAKKNDAQGARFNELADGEHLRNTSRLLALKEAEITALRNKVEDLSKHLDALHREFDRMRALHVEELSAIKAENAQLTLLLGSKLKELVHLQSLKDVFSVLQKVEEIGEKTGS